MEEFVVPVFNNKQYPYTPEGMAELAKDRKDLQILEAQMEYERNRPKKAELEWQLSIVENRCAICVHLKLEQKEPAILREDLFMPLVHPRILPPEKWHEENLLICDECWNMCT